MHLNHYYDIIFIYFDSVHKQIKLLLLFKLLFPRPNNFFLFKCIQKVPLKILVINRYILVSIINYFSGHYVAYVRRYDGNWELHNDIQPKIEKIRNKDSIRNINPHILMYIKI